MLVLAAFCCVPCVDPVWSGFLSLLPTCRGISVTCTGSQLVPNIQPCGGCKRTRGHFTPVPWGSLRYDPHGSLTSVDICILKRCALSNRSFIQTHSLVISPLGPVGVANLGSIPWVSRMCLAAGLSRNLHKQAGVRDDWQQLGLWNCRDFHKSHFLSFNSQIFSYQSFCHLWNHWNACWLFLHIL